MLALFSATVAAFENPFLQPGATTLDGNPGAFGQNNTGDCFFLASLIATGHDKDGAALIESSIRRVDTTENWRIVFPNLPDKPVTITLSELSTYQLTDSNGDGQSLPALGDPDVGLLEIAADKIWKTHVKKEGLWDDVPMNALFMFSGAPQLLLWNRDQARPEHNADIDKYRRLPTNIITEIPIHNIADAQYRLRNLLAGDQDGISLILIDYLDYHAAAIVDIDFDAGSYRYINPHQTIILEGSLDALYQGLAGGYYALNYIEIPAFVGVK